MGGNVKIGSDKASIIYFEYRDKLAIDLIVLIDKLSRLYNRDNNEPLYNTEIKIEELFSGTSRYYINVNEIPNSFIKTYIPSIGDIDFMVDISKRKNINILLEKCCTIDFGIMKLIGYKQSPNQTITLWNWNEINIQIDFEYVEFVNGIPTEFSVFTYSTAKIDLEYGLKGCFHKFLIRALTGLTLENRIVKNKRGKSVAKYDNLLSFSNNGLRKKYRECDNGNFLKLKITESIYETNIPAIFRLLFENRLPLSYYLWYRDCFSFIGLLNLIKKYCHLYEKTKILDCYFYFITKDDARIVNNDLNVDMKLKQKSLRIILDKLLLTPSNEMNEYLNKEL